MRMHYFYFLPYNNQSNIISDAIQDILSDDTLKIQVKSDTLSNTSIVFTTMLYKSYQSDLLFEKQMYDKKQSIVWGQRRIGGFSFFHFTKINSECCFYINQTTLLSLPVGLKLRNFTFRFLVPGVPLRNRRKLFVFNFALLYLFQ